MSGTEGKPPALPGPKTETTRVPGSRRRPGEFERVETRPPDRGRSVQDGMAELARRRAAGETGRRPRRAPAETYTAPDGTRIAIPPAPAAPAAAAPAAPGAGPSLIAPVDLTTAAIGAAIKPPAPPPVGAPLAAPAPSPPPTGAPAAPPGQASLTDPAQGAHQVAVTIDGQAHSLPLAELVQGYLRNRDYSQKTQQAAGALRQAQEAQGQFNVARERLEQRLTAMLALDADEFANPIDWVTLAKSDPIGYSQKHARYLARQEMLAEQGRLAEVRQREEQGRKVYALQTGHQALCQIIPGWADAATRGQLQAKMLQHLQQRGFTADEIARREMIDPREVIMLLESMLWAAHVMQGAARPTPAPGVPTMQGNGRSAVDTRNGGAPAADVTEADERFGRTRKLDDAVSLLRARRAAAGQT